MIIDNYNLNVLFYCKLIYNGFLIWIYATGENQLRPFVCDKCQRSYRQYQHWKRHVTYECGMAPSFHCPHCPFSTKRRDTLQGHVKTMHTSGAS